MPIQRTRTIEGVDDPVVSGAGQESWIFRTKTSYDAFRRPMDPSAFAGVEVRIWKK